MKPFFFIFARFTSTLWSSTFIGQKSGQCPGPFLSGGQQNGPAAL